MRAEVHFCARASGRQLRWPVGPRHRSAPPRPWGARGVLLAFPVRPLPPGSPSRPRPLLGSAPGGSPWGSLAPRRQSPDLPSVPRLRGGGTSRPPGPTSRSPRRLPAGRCPAARPPPPSPRRAASCYFYLRSFLKDRAAAPGPKGGCVPAENLPHGEGIRGFLFFGFFGFLGGGVLARSPQPLRAPSEPTRVQGQIRRVFIGREAAPD